MEGEIKMGNYTVRYKRKNVRPYADGSVQTFELTVRAENEEHARKIVYSRIDNRIYEIMED